MTLPKGITTRRTRSGILVAKVHYTADPERDSDWARSERLKYRSQAAWDCEQEIVHEAGGGELVFAEILNHHADKIIIRDQNDEWGEIPRGWWPYITGTASRFRLASPLFAVAAPNHDRMQTWR